MKTNKVWTVVHAAYSASKITDRLCYKIHYVTYDKNGKSTETKKTELIVESGERNYDLEDKFKNWKLHIYLPLQRDLYARALRAYANVASDSDRNFNGMEDFLKSTSIGAHHYADETNDDFFHKPVRK